MEELIKSFIKIRNKNGPRFKTCECDDDDDEYDNFYSAITQHMPLQGRLDKDHDTCQKYALSKQCDLSLDLNKSKVDAERMYVGMLFQHLSPATEKARSPKQVFDFRTFRLPLTSDRRCALDVDTPTQYDFRYSRSAPWRDCRLVRQVYSWYGTAQEASLDSHGAMASYGHTFDDCRQASLKSSRLTAACQADTLTRPQSPVQYITAWKPYRELLQDRPTHW